MLGVAGILTMENVLSMKITKLLGYTVQTLYQNYGLYILSYNQYTVPRERGPTTECQPTPPLGAQFPAKV